MAYSDEQIKAFKEKILNEVSGGMSLSKVLKQDTLPNKDTVYKWLNSEHVNYDSEFLDNYTRACEERAEAIFEDILDIADETHLDKKVLYDGREVTDNEAIQRSRLRVDARKWMLSRMNPKKYGDKIDVTTKGDKIEAQPIYGTNPLDAE